MYSNPWVTLQGFKSVGGAREGSRDRVGLTFWFFQSAHECSPEECAHFHHYLRQSQGFAWDAFTAVTGDNVIYLLLYWLSC